MHKKVILYDIFIDNLKMNEVLNYIIEFVRSGRKGFVVTPNVNHVVKLKKNKDLVDAYEKAELVLADGMPLIFFSKIFKKPIIEKISGSDLLVELLPIADLHGMRIFILGALDNVSKKALGIIKNEFPGIKIAGRYSPPVGFEKKHGENSKIVDMINKISPNFLFIFLGCPKQELWISKYIDQLDINFAFCFGAGLDFITGEVKRAPVWMQKLGCEWIFRMLSDPKRLIKRYLIKDMVPFFRYTLKEIRKREN